MSSESKDTTTNMKTKVSVHRPENPKGMEEGSRETEKQTVDEPGDESESDCPVCLQTCIHPVQLPCSHIFCFLCVKGVANRSRRCALCRQDIPSDFFCRPNLVRREDLQQTKVFDDEYQWFYEGQNGWWQYDDRTSIDIEAHYKKGVKTFELLIAGFVYVIDLDKMVQSQRNDRTKKRRVKRDTVDMPDRKGVAGLKFGHSSGRGSGGGSSGGVECDTDRPGADGDETAHPNSHQIMVPIPIHASVDHSMGYTNSLSPPTPYNTPQTPQTPAESPPNTSVPTEQDLAIQLERLRLGNPSLLSTSPQESLPGGAGAGPGDISPRGMTRLRPRGQSEACPGEGEGAETAEDVRSGLQETETEIYNQLQDEVEAGTAPSQTGAKRDGV